LSKICQHNFVFLNGLLLKTEEAKISPLSRGFLFGVGLFETIKILEGRSVHFSEHFERLRSSALKISFPFAIEAGKLQEQCNQLIVANSIAEAVLKIVLFEDNERVGEFIYTRPLNYLNVQYQHGFRLKTVIDFRLSNSLDNFKTLNYLKNIRAREIAKDAGFDEALFIDKAGEVLEGSVSNIFIVKNGQLLTPFADRVIPGIVRALLLGAEHGFKAKESIISARELYDADEVFITNSLIGVMPVACVDNHEYNLSKNPVTKNVTKIYRRLELRSI
jgi:branched-subunit amino acid aminotransferase/4-amino-4-deoxychorismate lyase